MMLTMRIITTTSRQGVYYNDMDVSFHVNYSPAHALVLFNVYYKVDNITRELPWPVMKQ